MPVIRPESRKSEKHHGTERLDPVAPTPSTKVHGGRWMELRPQEIERMKDIVLFCLEKRLKIKFDRSQLKRPYLFFQSEFAAKHGYAVIAPSQFKQLFEEKHMFFWKPEMWGCVALLLKDKLIDFVHISRAEHVKKMKTSKLEDYILRGKEDIDGWENLFGRKPMLADLPLKPLPNLKRSASKSGVKEENEEDEDDFDDNADMGDLSSVNKGEVQSLVREEKQITVSHKTAKRIKRHKAGSSTQISTRQEPQSLTTAERSSSIPIGRSSSPIDLASSTSSMPSSPPRVPIVIPKALSQAQDEGVRATITKANPSLGEITDLVHKETEKLKHTIRITINPVAKKLLEDELGFVKKRQTLWEDWLHAAKDIEKLELNDSSKERMRLSLQEMVNKEVAERGIFGEK